MDRSISKGKKSTNLTVICLIGAMIMAASMLLNYRAFNFYRHQMANSEKWLIIMMALNAFMLSGIVLLCIRKLVGLWIYFLGTIAFFTFPVIGGTIDSIMGLLTPVYFIAFSVLFILMGNEYKKIG
jgi:hypothetical protein